MNTDDLKLLAGYMGYKASHTESECWIYSGNNMRIIYNPLQNNDQLVELIERMFDKKRVGKDSGEGIWNDGEKWKAQAEAGGYVAEGESFAEAVVNAAIETIKKCS